ncbi:hypothetical protein [Mycoplasma buteonis]|uniref:hypothetical protein n=1 Tax=Mycoplasma buteonis TaxID=171280 RepID=UPI00055AD285|nr:hypothetical protein [Mycoplasma buteonis]
MLKKLLFIAAPIVSLPLLSSSCQKVDSESEKTQKKRELKNLTESNTDDYGEFTNINDKFNKTSLLYLLNTDLSGIFSNSQINEFKEFQKWIKTINQKLNKNKNQDTEDEIIKINFYLDYLKSITLQKDIQYFAEKISFFKTLPHSEDITFNLKNIWNTKNKYEIITFKDSSEKEKPWWNAPLDFFANENYYISNGIRDLPWDNFKSYPAITEIKNDFQHSEVFSEEVNLPKENQKIADEMKVKNDKSFNKFVDFYQKYSPLLDNLAISHFANKIKNLIDQDFDYKEALSWKSILEPIKEIKVSKINLNKDNLLDILLNSDSITLKNVAKIIALRTSNDLSGQEISQKDFDDLIDELRKIKENDLISVVKKSNELLKKYDKKLNFYKISIPIYVKDKNTKIEITFDKLKYDWDQKIKVTYKPKLYSEASYLSFDEFKEVYDAFLDNYIQAYKLAESSNDNNKKLAVRYANQASIALVEILESKLNELKIYYSQPAIEVKEFLVAMEDSSSYYNDFKPLFIVNSQQENNIVPFWLSGYDLQDDFWVNLRSSYLWPDLEKIKANSVPDILSRIK